MECIRHAILFIYSVVLIFILPDKLANFRKKYGFDDVNTQSVFDFRKKQIESLFLVLGAYTIAYIASRHHIIISWHNIIPNIILAYAVFGQCGWKIQTWGGQTFIEKLDSYWFRFFSFIGLTGTIWNYFT